MSDTIFCLYKKLSQKISPQKYHHEFIHSPLDSIDSKIPMVSTIHRNPKPTSRHGPLPAEAAWCSTLQPSVSTASESNVGKNRGKNRGKRVEKQPWFLSRAKENVDLGWFNDFLVGGPGPPLWKIWTSIGMISNPIYGKIQNVPNHQPVLMIRI